MESVTRPTLLIREQVCRENIRRMAEKAAASKVIFRPHFKTHQSLQVAGWFREQGVEAITVSSAEMAGCFASAGWRDITIAFPANVREIYRYRELAQSINLNLLVDSANVAGYLAGHLKAEAGIFIEIDCGYKRSGIQHTDEKKIMEVLHIIHQAGNLTIKGLISHAGNTYSAGNTTEIRGIYAETLEKLQFLKERLKAAGYPNMLISVGDTPSCSIVDDLGGVDEIRPGNFVYYDLMQYHLGSCSLDNIAVSVACPVVGIYPGRNEIVIYGGAVHLSKEYLPLSGKCFGLVVSYTHDGWSSPLPDTQLAGLSQEHGIIQATPEIMANIKHGDLLGVLPVHSCLTADLLKSHTRIV